MMDIISKYLKKRKKHIATAIDLILMATGSIIVIILGILVSKFLFITVMGLPK